MLAFVSFGLRPSEGRLRGSSHITWRGFLLAEALDGQARGGASGRFGLVPDRRSDLRPDPRLPKWQRPHKKGREPMLALGHGGQGQRKDG